MVGRTPEYLGKKIEPREMKLVSLYILLTPVTVLVLAAIALSLPTARASILNPGPHGLTEVLYAFTSATNNNGSAFAGLSGNTDFYNVDAGIGDADRPVRLHRAGDGAGGVARRQEARAGVGRDLPHDLVALRRVSWPA